MRSAATARNSATKSRLVDAGAGAGAGDEAGGAVDGCGLPHGLFEKGGDFAQSLRGGELVEDFLNFLLLLGRAELLQRGEDFDALDGVDAEVGFDAGVQIEHLRWIAGAFGGDGTEFADEVAAGGRGCGGRGCSGRRDWPDGLLENPGDFAQSLSAGEFVKDRLHLLLLLGGAELLHRGEDFDALDGVDTQIGFDAGVEVEHLRRIAGALGGYTAQIFDEATLYGWRRSHHPGWRRSDRRGRRG